LSRKFLLRRWILIANRDIRLELHLLKPFLHVLCQLWFSLRPIMYQLNLCLVLPLMFQVWLVVLDVSLLEVSLGFALGSQIELKTLFVLLWLVLAYCVNEDGIFGSEFVWDIFRRLLFIWLPRLFTKTSHIRLGRLYLWWLSDYLTLLRLYFRSRSSSLRWNFSSLDLFFLDYRRFILGWHRIQHSLWLYFIPILIKICNVNNLPLIILESFGGIFDFTVNSPPISAIGIDDSFYQIERYIGQFLLGFFFALFRGKMGK
jgi:hypothetical protein